MGLHINARRCGLCAIASKLWELEQKNEPNNRRSTDSCPMRCRKNSEKYPCDGTVQGISTAETILCKMRCFMVERIVCINSRPY